MMMCYEAQKEFSERTIKLLSSIDTEFQTVLVLAGIQLTFFAVASMGLSFGFVLKSVDNTGMFSLLLSRVHTQPRLFLLLTPPHQ